MSLKTDEPHIPDKIQQKIQQLQALLDQASNLYDEIVDWYGREIKSYDPKADASDELFDPGTGIVVEGISGLAILEGLSVLQTNNEAFRERERLIPGAVPRT